MTINFHATAISHVGLVRAENQDSGYATSNIIAVADGMGGQADGAIASSLTITNIATLNSHTLLNPQTELKTTLNKAHSELIQYAKSNPASMGLGTTCTTLICKENKLHLAHIGDSRAYRLQNGELQQVTHDHTWVQYLVDIGEITPEEARTHKDRSKLIRALSDLPELLEIDENVYDANVGDRWLLCSDGLYGVVEQERLAKALADIPDRNECAQYLVEQAIAGGGPDNITVIIADIVESDHSEQPQQLVGAVTVPRDFNLNINEAKKTESPVKEQKNSSTPAKAKKKTGRKLLGFAVVLFLLFTAGISGYNWTQNQYFVAPAQNKVAIYKGIPQNIGPLKLSSIHRKTNIDVSELSPVAQKRLETPIIHSSVKKAEKMVENLKEYEAKNQPNIVPESN